ncbi:polysaccharide biosynthesis/export family protein [Candidatus Thiosymbion oneisti]|uniref:polysaccharide biosynthesis/export family protein n=1 Tax=Candidatus Thiosymbion oneisti TaxID=589554 RepID=UPI0015B7578A|nr:polysaccharide biosynthesis/export family protein [Candidatus Thiosymbion oneisti]
MAQESHGGGQMVPAVVGLPPSPGNDAIYRIGPHDLLEIAVFNVDELSSEERVNEDGSIIMPLIGSVSVGGLTLREAEQRLADILGRTYLQDPQVNIFVSEYASQDVTVVGAVREPGVFPLRGRTTLLQVIALAGGVNELANEDEVVIFRGQGTPHAQAYVVSLDKIQDGNLPDPVLVGDDRVVVPKSGTVVFFKGIRDTLRGFVHLGTVGIF